MKMLKLDSGCWGWGQGKDVETIKKKRNVDKECVLEKRKIIFSILFLLSMKHFRTSRWTCSL